MTRIVVRLVLTFLVIPAVLVVIILIGELISRFTRFDDDAVFLTLFATASVGYCVYFFLLWRSLIRWTPRRITRTIVFSVALFVALLIGCGGLALVIDSWRVSQYIAMLCCASALLWACVASWMWVETPRERIERIRDAGPLSHVCPLCKYDMSGLKNLTCPECGVEFTVASWTREQHDRRMVPDTDA